MNAHRLGTAPRIVLAQAIVHAVAGTFVHNAGCIWNDICDRRFDRHVGMVGIRSIETLMLTIFAYA